MTVMDFFKSSTFLYRQVDSRHQLSGERSLVIQ